MAELIQDRVVSRSPSTHTPSRGDPAEAILHRELSSQARRRALDATWTSTLSAKDVACLMSVIELQVLPRLVAEYRPADRNPLQRSILA